MLCWEITAVPDTSPPSKRVRAIVLFPALLPHLLCLNDFRHVNVGSDFQAEIPDLQARSRLEEEEEGASLVWKPWGDIATNPETQDRGFS